MGDPKSLHSVKTFCFVSSGFDFRDILPVIKNPRKELL